MKRILLIMVVLCIGLGLYRFFPGKWWVDDELESIGLHTEHLAELIEDRRNEVYRLIILMESTCMDYRKLKPMMDIFSEAVDVDKELRDFYGKYEDWVTQIMSDHYDNETGKFTFIEKSTMEKELADELRAMYNDLIASLGDDAATTAIQSNFEDLLTPTTPVAIRLASIYSFEMEILKMHKTLIASRNLRLDKQTRMIF